MNIQNILLGHGSGGKMSHELISELFLHYFDNQILQNQTDSAILTVNNNKLAFTTDSFVVDPLFFPGGNIGKLAVAGTVNDLAVSGAIPMYLSAGFIIEEGFPFQQLKEIVKTMGEEAASAGVKIVTGDTKVVNKGKCDKLFINTSGVGVLPDKFAGISLGENISAGDKILINGEIGAHGMTIMAARNDLKINAPIASDCACLNMLIKEILDAGIQVKFMRDATRGGVATVLAEMVKGKKFGLQIYEKNLVVEDGVRGMCELLGFDSLYVANEGKVIMVVPQNQAEKALKILQNHPLGKKGTIIGEITTENPGKAWLNTVIGGKRIIDMLSGMQLPRIC